MTSIPANALHRGVRDAIEPHIPARAWEARRLTEETERRSFDAFLANRRQRDGEPARKGVPPPPWPLTPPWEAPSWAVAPALWVRFP